MNNEIITATQNINKAYPVYYASADSAFKHVNSYGPDMKRRVSRNSNFEDLALGKELIKEMEATPLETEKNEALDVFKMTSNQQNILRNFSSFIDISKLEIEIIDRKNPGKLLFTSKFISLYLRLSQREKQVLKQLSFMKTSEEIARILFISCNTVKNHRKNIKQKLEFDSRAESSRFLYWVRGFVSLPSGI